MTKERPILFNGPMVRALLEGRKTQTRRVVNPPGRPLCPYGVPGDVLYVRETWAIHDAGQRVRVDESMKSRLRFPATDKAPAAEDYWWNKRPSIHMPKWACRIHLEVENVRVERVQDISSADAWAEGVRPAGVSEIAGDGSLDQVEPEGATLNEFRELWDSINEKRGFGWDTNPYVWCVTFKVMA